MATVFDIGRVNANPARFDLRKCTAINAEWIRTLSAQDLANRLVPYLLSGGIFSTQPSDADLAVLLKAMPLIQERMETLRQGVQMVSFLFNGNPGSPDFEVDPDEAAKVLTTEAQPVLIAALSALNGVSNWQTEKIEEALRVALIDGLGLKPKVAFGPVRVAVTGRRVSPPLFESLELLGKVRALSRIQSAIG